MADQTVNSVTSALTGELAGRAFSGLMQKFSQKVAFNEKLQRLEMLLIIIHSAVEASKKHAIENTWLLQWRDKLQEAALQGDEVLATIKQRVMDAQAQDNVNSSRQQDGPSSSIPSAAAADVAATASASAMSFARNSLSGMVHGIRLATKVLFSGDADSKKLDAMVEKLEKLSPDVGVFVELLKHEVLPKVEKSRPNKRKRLPFTAIKCMVASLSMIPPQFASMMVIRTSSKDGGPAAAASTTAVILNEILGVALVPVEVLLADTPEQEFLVWYSLLLKLTEALGKVHSAIEMVEERELKGWGELAQWAALLEEAFKQGRAVHINTIIYLRMFTCRSGEATVKQEHEEEEVYGLVRSLEVFASNVEHFISLATLCPWNKEM